MKLKVYQEQEQETRELRLRLVERTDGSVRLELVDGDGCAVERGILLSIDSQGYLWLSRGVDQRLGLPLDDHGRLKIKAT